MAGLRTLSALLLLQFTCHAFEQTFTNAYEKSEMADLRLSEGKNSTFISHINCAIDCSNDQSCMSFSYHNISGKCHLYPVPFTLDSLAPISDVGWTTYHVSGAGCPSHLGYFHKRNISLCYRLVIDNKRPSNKVGEFCASEGARVIRIDSLAKQIHIAEFLLSGKSHTVYIGGRSAKGDNIFTFEDDSPVLFTYWADSFPSNTTAILLRKSHDFLWSNAAGGKARLFLCEIPL